MVLAKETKLQELLEGSKQYQVPLYQRTYSWSTDQLKQLWEDITQLAEDRVDDHRATHFIGSVVLTPSPANGPTGVQEFLLIDGQQRLTSLSILLCAIREHRAARDGALHRERINEQYLINKWESGRQRLKLVPTQADRAAYLACLDSTPQAGGVDRVGAAYRFFSARLAAADDPDDPRDIARIEDAVISGLALVSVISQQGDNPHRIFESLNNTGLRLTQADLLRNYLFMRLPTRGDVVYESRWLPLQQALDRDQLELLFWLDLVQRDPRVKQADIYTGQQRRLERMRTEDDIEAEVARLGGLGQLLRTILDPSREPDQAVRHRLTRLGAWGTTTVYPVLLHLLERRANGTADSAEIASAMLYLESYFVRRLLIGRATAGINRTLLSIVTEIDATAPADEAIRRYLSTGRKYFAGDREIRAAARSVPYYLNGRPHQRTLVLRWLEETYGSKEPVDPTSLTIEHVLPQTPTPAWRESLTADLAADEEFGQAHEALVHTLGNLTLTGYNSTLSNSPFPIKRPQLAGSGVLMNQEIAQQERWGRPQIHERADALAERMIAEWPGPADRDQATAPGTAWEVMNQALAELPPGSWTTYGDLAALIGSHAQAIGQRLATTPAPNAHRVLQSQGTVSPNFAWLDPTRTDDPRTLLAAEGVVFDHLGRADQTQRVTTEGLALLLGADVPDLRPAPEPGQDPGSDARFLGQLAERQGHDIAEAVVAVTLAWTAIGGYVAHGSGQETSRFLLSREKSHPAGRIWPVVIYPSGTVEVVFQHLRGRPPFDDPARREEFRTRLNGVDGIHLPAGKIDLRPGFDLGVLLDASAREKFVQALDWFHAVVRDNEPPGSDVP
ncbi:DUF262 domain-containing protein [Actinokineospora auranticolor]|uniref:Uncharacterized protein with ParB-like and HNH nuclease domain n=1 Tax=Actinokineospora auranticolor TaxID=155976 RepID=A0A2S6GEX5_9PSEU|nr:DUF262 domain-containing protein [Actinokineospora auranticolor]PPK63787.1 uncharacterized protein with ParB-like and HNH nuclease domain [Actinokineospora auranticolor]